MFHEERGEKDILYMSLHVILCGKHYKSQKLRLGSFFDIINIVKIKVLQANEICGEDFSYYFTMLIQFFVAFCVF